MAIGFRVLGAEAVGSRTTDHPLSGRVLRDGPMLERLDLQVDSAKSIPPGLTQRLRASSACGESDRVRMGAGLVQALVTPLSGHLPPFFMHNRTYAAFMIPSPQAPSDPSPQPRRGPPRHAHDRDAEAHRPAGRGRHRLPGDRDGPYVRDPADRRFVTTSTGVCRIIAERERSRTGGRGG